MISKPVEVAPGRWVMVSEYPDGSLSLEGIQREDSWRDSDIHPYHGNYQTIRIRFSKAAIAALVPLMQEWLDSKEEDNEIPQD